MNVEDLLREAVAPRSGSDPAVEERVRREAMTALTGMRRRHRMRRAVSIGAGAAGVAAVAGFLVFAMPRGGDRSESADLPAPGPRPAVALLGIPGQPRDRLPGDAARYGVDPAPRTVRFAGAGERLRFYAALLTNGRLCVLATTRTGGRPRGATCNDPAVLAHVGVLTFERGRAEAGPDGRVILDRAFLVPDGIRAVIAAGRKIRVRDNLAVQSTTWRANPTITLVGPAARAIRPEAGPDWPRGSSAGVPTVTVPVSMGSVRSARPTPIRAVRLVVPAAAPAGSVIDLRVIGPDGLLGENIIYGVDAYLERRTTAGWRPFYGLYVGTPEQGSPGPPVLLGPDGFAVNAIGLTGGGPRPVRLPDVPPGTYRISRSVLDSSSGSPVDRTLTAEIRITAG